VYFGDSFQGTGVYEAISIEQDTPIPAGCICPAFQNASAGFLTKPGQSTDFGGITGIVSGIRVTFDNGSTAQYDLQESYNGYLFVPRGAKSITKLEMTLSLPNGSTTLTWP
jgi:hypothetical protein